MENKSVKRSYDDVVLDRKDIEAVASSRFFRRAGIRILCLWAFITLIIVTVYRFATVMPDILAFILLALDAIVFIYIYSKKSTEARMMLISSMDNYMLSQRKAQSGNKPQG